MLGINLLRFGGGYKPTERRVPIGSLSSGIVKSRCGGGDKSSSYVRRNCVIMCLFLALADG